MEPNRHTAMQRAIRLPLCRASRSSFLAGIFLLMFLTGCAGCHRSGPPVEHEGADTLHLASSNFDGSQIPAEFTCSGFNRSPELHWNAPPPQARSLALIVNDRDGPGGTFVHWILFNLPPTTTALPPSIPAVDRFPDGARQGKNDFGQLGYGGPCPSGHSPHHYAFMLFALDSSLDLPAGATRAQLDRTMVGHVLARGELIARFHR